MPPMEPDRIAEFAKRDMGCPVYSRPVAGKQYPPEVIESFILKKVKPTPTGKIGPFTQSGHHGARLFRRAPPQGDPGRRLLAGSRGPRHHQRADGGRDPLACRRVFSRREGPPRPRASARLRPGRRDVRRDGDGDRRGASTRRSRPAAMCTWEASTGTGGSLTELPRSTRPSTASTCVRTPAALQRLMQTAEDTKRALTARQEVNVAF